MRKRQYKLMCQTCSSEFDGYHSTNKFCSSRCSSKSDKRKESTKNYAAKRRTKIQEYKLSKGCAICGYNKHPAALDFAHLEQKTKSFNISQDPKRKWEDTLKEIEKCRVLCRNCHAVETIENKHHVYRS
jgi:hypothetical protein